MPCSFGLDPLGLVLKLPILEKKGTVGVQYGWCTTLRSQNRFSAQLLYRKREPGAEGQSPDHTAAHPKDGKHTGRPTLPFYNVFGPCSWSEHNVDYLSRSIPNARC